MNFIKKILSGDLIKNVDSLVDNLTTTKEEKLILKNKMKEILVNAEAKAQEQVTRRWEADAKAGWLPANIRPLTLAFLIISTVLLIFIDSGVIDFQVSESWVDLLTMVLVTVIGSYFGGRSFEKIKKR